MIKQRNYETIEPIRFEIRIGGELGEGIIDKFPDELDPVKRGRGRDREMWNGEGGNVVRKAFLAILCFNARLIWMTEVRSPHKSRLVSLKLVSKDTKHGTIILASPVP